jgi:HK97 family phage portal protein
MGFLDAIAERLGYQKAMPSRGPGMLSSTSGGTGIQIDTLPRFKTGSASQYLNRYGDQAWVFACIRVIQSKGAGVPLKVYKKNGDNLDEQPNHPLKTLLDYVNPFMNGYDLMEATHGYLELTGNAYWLLDAFVNGKPTEIYPLNPQMVKIRASKSKFIDGYVYNPTGNPSDQVLLAADEIIHFKNWHPSDPYYGLSPLAAAREAADSMLFADRYNKSFFANSAEPGGVLQSDEIIVDEATRTRILSAWNQSHSGVRKAHRIALLEGGLKFIKTASSHNDMQFVELKKMSREDILAVYGVPPIMVGVFDEANYSNAREQRRIFWVDSMVPRLSKIESVLNEWLAIPWGGDIVLAHDLSGIEALKQDEKLSAEVDEIRSRSGLMTINEIREGMKMPPVPWGDTWNAPLGLSPIDGRDSPQELQEPPQEPPPAPPEPFEPPAPPAPPKEPEPKAVFPPPPIPSNSVKTGQETVGHAPTHSDTGAGVSGLPGQPPAASDAPGDKVQDADQAKAKRDAVWALFKASTESQEKKWASILKGIFKDQEAECLRNLQDSQWAGRAVQLRLDGKKNFKDAVDLILFDRGEARKIFRKEGKKLFTFSLESAAKAEMELYDLGVFDVTNPRVVAWIESKVFRFAQQITETTEMALRKTLGQAIENGEGMSDVSKRISDVFDIAQGSRTDMIARTEVVSASNAGAYAAYEQSGVSKVEWITARDLVVRPSHQIDGEEKNLGELFSNGLQYPGDPTADAGDIINCRCTIAPARRDDNG